MKRFAVILLAVLAGGCNSSLSQSTGASVVPLPLANADAKSHPIEHIVIIVQENRSFDNMFQGYPGADTVTSGKNSKGQTIALRPVGLAKQYVIDHSLSAMIAA